MELCAICQEEGSSSNNPVVTLDCGHKFHQECIIKYFREYDSKCPICRDDPRARREYAELQREEEEDRLQRVEMDRRREEERQRRQLIERIEDDARRKSAAVRRSLHRMTVGPDEIGLVVKRSRKKDTVKKLSKTREKWKEALKTRKEASRNAKEVLESEEVTNLKNKEIELRETIKKSKKDLQQTQKELSRKTYLARRLVYQMRNKERIAKSSFEKRARQVEDSGDPQFQYLKEDGGWSEKVSAATLIRRSKGENPQVKNTTLIKHPRFPTLIPFRDIKNSRYFN